MKVPQIKKILVIYKEIEATRGPLQPEHPKTLETIEKVLKKNVLSYHVVLRSHVKKMEDYDLIITVGGDGTFLDASHYASPRQLLLGVNSNPSTSHGAFCCADRNNFEKIFSRLLHKKVPLLLLNRLQVFINRKKVPILALNDTLFANRTPAGTSRYLLKVGKNTEEQKSSGIWISTAAGSTAALRSAGGKPMVKTSKDLQFMVREPFVKKGKKYKQVHGWIKRGQSLKIVSRMSRAAIFLDGAHLHYEVGYGDVVEVRSAGEPIQAVL
jgi:NAD+ kinase